MVASFLHMTGHKSCAHCVHHIKHPFHAELGICSNENSSHHQQWTGASLRCAHCERRALKADDIAVPSLLSVHVVTSEKRKLKAV